MTTGNDADRAPRAAVQVRNVVKPAATRCRTRGSKQFAKPSLPRVREASSILLCPDWMRQNTAGSKDWQGTFNMVHLVTASSKPAASYEGVVAGLWRWLSGIPSRVSVSAFGLPPGTRLTFVRPDDGSVVLSGEVGSDGAFEHELDSNHIGRALTVHCREPSFKYIEGESVTVLPWGVCFVTKVEVDPNYNGKNVHPLAASWNPNAEFSKARAVCTETVRSRIVTSRWLTALEGTLTLTVVCVTSFWISGLWSLCVGFLTWIIAARITAKARR